MKNTFIPNFNSLIFLPVFVLSIIFVGCSFEEDLTPSIQPIYPPSGMKIASIDSSTVLVSWTLSPDDSDPRVQGYRLSWAAFNTEDTSVIKPDSVLVPHGTSSCEATKLLPGYEYTFTLAMRTTGGDAYESVYSSILIAWGSTYVFDSVTCSTSNYLTVFDGVSGPSLITISDTTNGQANADLLVQRKGDSLYLESASVLGTNWRVTNISTYITDATAGLATGLTSFPHLSTFTESNIALQNNKIYYVRTQTGNFARLYARNISLQGNTDGTVLLDISYQKNSTLGFAKK